MFGMQGKRGYNRELGVEKKRSKEGRCSKVELRELLFCGPFFHLTVLIQPVHDCDRNSRQGSQEMMGNGVHSVHYGNPQPKGTWSRTPECQSTLFFFGELPYNDGDYRICANQTLRLVSLKLHPPNSVAREKRDGSTEYLL